MAETSSRSEMSIEPSTPQAHACPVLLVRERPSRAIRSSSTVAGASIFRVPIRAMFRTLTETLGKLVDDVTLFPP